jgi:hypothetical protein
VKELLSATAPEEPPPDVPAPVLFVAFVQVTLTGIDALSDSVKSAHWYNNLSLDLDSYHQSKKFT